MVGTNYAIHVTGIHLLKGENNSSQISELDSKIVLLVKHVDTKEGLAKRDSWSRKHGRTGLHKTSRGGLHWSNGLAKQQRVIKCRIWKFISEA